ncbi:MAG: molybdenum cofactor guanylyltransferase [Candidatus Aminicenantes bacterium]|nr:molybdenum cofactor guanylyltransferase [Candidatus Aminicenantes bacterium]
MKDQSDNQSLPYSLIILAGGDSRRMNQDKALLPVGEGTLIEYVLEQIKSHFIDTILSISESDKFKFLNQKLVVDEKKGYGPLMGIKSALAASPNEKNFVMACDIPKIPLKLLDKILLKGQNFDIVVPVTPKGRIEPLFAVYSKSILPQMEQLIEDNIHSLLPLFDICKTGYVKLNTESLLKNLNTRKDYEDFLQQL